MNGYKECDVKRYVRVEKASACQAAGLVKDTCMLFVGGWVGGWVGVGGCPCLSIYVHALHACITSCTSHRVSMRMPVYTHPTHADPAPPRPHVPHPHDYAHPTPAD